MTEQVNETTEQPQQPVSLGLNDLQTVLQIIDIASQRGAFKAPELAAVGLVYNKINTFLEAAKQAQANKEEGSGPVETPAQETVAE